MVFKIILRNKEKQQIRKTIYASERDYKLYSPDTIFRWRQQGTVEEYSMLDDKWRIFAEHSYEPELWKKKLSTP